MKQIEELIKEKGNVIIEIINEIMNSNKIIDGEFEFDKFENKKYQLRISLYYKQEKLSNSKHFSIDLEDIFEHDTMLLEYLLNTFLEKYLTSETVAIDEFLHYHDFIFGSQNQLKIFNLNGSNITLKWSMINDYANFKKVI